MRFYAGLDLGKQADPSALVILDQLEEGEYVRYECGHLQRFPLGMSYPRIVDTVGWLLKRKPLADDCQLVIDATGVGVAVADMFEDAGIPYIGIVITGGVGWHRESRRLWHVSKHLLVSTVQKYLSSEALGIRKQLPEAEVMRKELQDFRVKISKAANEIYESREGAHDDLILAGACALFVAEHPGQKWLPIGV